MKFNAAGRGNWGFVGTPTSKPPGATEAESWLQPGRLFSGNVMPERAVLGLTCQTFHGKRTPAQDFVGKAAAAELETDDTTNRMQHFVSNMGMFFFIGDPVVDIL